MTEMIATMIQLAQKLTRKLAKRIYRKLNVILYTSFLCNYSCPYCVIRKSERLKDYPRESEFPWQQWVLALNSLPPAHIAISGGETLIYPGLIDLIENLSTRHFVSFTTNLFRVPRRLLTLKRSTKPAISASFHPSMTEIEAFIRRVQDVRDHGFNISIEMVAYPQQLQRITDYKRRFEKELSVPVHVDPFIMPGNAYTPQELKLLNGMGIRNRKFGFDESGGRTLKSCRAGGSHLVLVPNGDVFACHAGFYYATSSLHERFRAPLDEFRLGNLFNGTFRLNEKPRICSLPCSEACDLEGAHVREIRKG
jgi:MoaA/NifB/PqqE/SkfB family radical SAM enzyme